MLRLLKIVTIIIGLHLCIQHQATANTIDNVHTSALHIEVKSLQQKPKNKKEKSDSAEVESPIQIMFRDLLEYLYFPGVPEEEKTDDKKKKSKSNQNQKKN
jgi:hypothetical protein